MLSSQMIGQSLNLHSGKKILKVVLLQYTYYTYRRVDVYIIQTVNSLLIPW